MCIRDSVKSVFPTSFSIQQKYAATIAALPNTVLEQLQDALPTILSSENPFQTLEDILVERFEIPKEEKLKQLISGEVLGDSKPSQLMQRMLVLRNYPN